MATTPTNTIERPYRRISLITEGKVLVPTRILISYRFKPFTVIADDDPIVGVTAPAPTISVYATISNDYKEHGTAPVNYTAPVLLNASGNPEVLYNSMDSTSAGYYAPGEDTYTALETSQFIYLNRNIAVTSIYVVINGMEHIAKKRECILFYRTKGVENEKYIRLY